MSSSTVSIGNNLSKTDGLCIISLEKSIKIVSFSSKVPTDNLLRLIICPFVLSFSAISLANDLTYVPLPQVTSNSAELTSIIFFKVKL